MSRTIVLPFTCRQFYCALFVLAHILMIYSLSVLFSEFDTRFLPLWSVFGAAAGMSGTITGWWIIFSTYNIPFPKFKCKCEEDKQ